MKVLWFTNTPCNGAAELGLSAIHGGWLQSLDIAIQERVELHVAFYYSKKQESFNHAKATYHPINRGDWRWEALKNIFRVNIADDEDLEKYLEIIKEVKPDIIHIHGTENPFATILTKIEVPVVVSIQGILTVYQQKYFSGIDAKFAARPLNNGSLKKRILTPSFRQGFDMMRRMAIREQKNLLNTQYVLGRTHWDRRVCSVLAPNAHYFESGEIMRDIFYTKEWEYKTGQLVIHSTSGENLYKGFETICETMHLLLNLEVDVIWNVAGVSESDAIVLAARRKLGERFSLRNINLLGKLNVDQLLEKLLAATIYVMPSHIENSPNNLCEAMLIGMPCIATAVGGTPSILKDEQEGLLVQDGDPWAMAGAILEMHCNPVKARYYAGNARATALVRHDPKKIVDGLLEIYASVIEKSKAELAEYNEKTA